MSKNLNQNEKHFKQVQITLPNQTLNDNSFSDITFNNFFGFDIIGISNKAFGNSLKSIKLFWCRNCLLQKESPNYDFYNVFVQMDKLELLVLGLNLTEIPSNAFNTSNQHNLSHLRELDLLVTQNLTIKSNAFKNLKNLQYLTFFKANIKKLENESLNFGGNLVDRKLSVDFDFVNLTPDSFETGTFDGFTKPIVIRFLYNSSLDYFPEATFKSVLNNKNNTIMNFNKEPSFDCENCKNFWLIKDNKEGQMKNIICKQDSGKKVKRTLFNQEIKNKLNLKCNKTNF